MGDIADAIIDGEFDYITGEYLGRGCGYPRTMERQPNAKYGVCNYLNKRGIINQKQMDVIRKYFPDENTDNISKETLCIRISKDFGAFVKYVNEYLKIKSD